LNKILLQIAAELKVRPAQVNAAVELLDGGATVPFIARYRKEATDGMDDTQLRELEARLAYLRELEDRRPNYALPSRPRPPNRSWKTSTCPTSRGAAPRA
jgi:transcriptional accessory protein Tex/SPT6